METKGKLVNRDHHDPNGGFRNPWDSFQKRSTISLFGSIRKEPEKGEWKGGEMGAGGGGSRDNG